MFSLTGSISPLGAGRISGRPGSDHFRPGVSNSNSKARFRVEAPSPEEELTKLVLNGVTSDHTERSYRTGLEQFFAWLETKPRQPFSKALVGEYRAHLVQLKLSPSTLNLRLSPLRKLAREMADNGLLDPGVARAIECIKGVTQEGVRIGNWLLKEEANELLNAPDPSTLKGKRDRAILALLVSCAGCAAPSSSRSMSTGSSSVRAAGSYPTWWEKGTGVARLQYPPR